MKWVPRHLICSILLMLSLPAVSDEPSKDIDRAQTLRRSGQTDEAETILGKVLAVNPDNYRATYVLGLTYAAANKMDLALATLQKAAALREKTGSKDYTIYNTLGWAYMQIGDLPHAKAFFKRGVDAKAYLSRESYARVTNNLALAYMSEGDTENAEPLLKESVEAGNKMAQFNLKIVETMKSKPNP